MPLCKACPGCGGIVHIRKVSCSCGHVFATKHNKPLLTSSRKHTLRSFRAIETDEKASERRSVDRACKAKKRMLEIEEEALERKSRNRACEAKKSTLETEEEAFERKSCNRAREAKKRALETEEEAVERKSCNRAREAKKRALETEEEADKRKSCNKLVFLGIYMYLQLYSQEYYPLRNLNGTELIE